MKPVLDIAWLCLFSKSGTLLEGQNYQILSISRAFISRLLVVGLLCLISVVPLVYLVIKYQYRRINGVE